MNKEERDGALYSCKECPFGKEDVVHIHNGMLLSYKKEWHMAFAATWMDLEIIILSEVS